MKIAVIADTHSNYHALRAVLEDIASERPDVIVAAGDMVGCSVYPGARQVWGTLVGSGIAGVMGNNEQRVLDYFAGTDARLRQAVQFMPLQYFARELGPALVKDLANLPPTLLLAGPHGQDVLICHASPGDLNRSPAQGINDRMAQALEAVPAAVVVSGHLHHRWHQRWHGKLLVMAGSAGLPMRLQVGEVDYLLLEYLQGGWCFRYKTVAYDCQSAISEAASSDFLAQAGPIGWLMFDESLHQCNGLMPFFTGYCAHEKPDDYAGWARLARGYLESIGHWQTLAPYLAQASPALGSLT